MASFLTKHAMGHDVCVDNVDVLIDLLDGLLIKVEVKIAGHFSNSFACLGTRQILSHPQCYSMGSFVPKSLSP